MKFYKNALIPVGFIAVVYCLAHFFRPYIDAYTTRNSFLGIIPIGNAGFNAAPRVGRIHGIKISVPANYFYFAFEYEDESVWDPKKKPHDENSEVNNFAIYVRWPSMEPKLSSNYDSYKASLRTNGPNDWLNIELKAKPSLNAEEQRKIQQQNGLSHMLQRQIDRLEPSYQWRDKSLDPSAHYEIRGLNPALGLQEAIPVGIGAKSSIWDLTLYWDGDRTRQVTTYITCWHFLGKPGTIRRCEQRFELPEMKADLIVRYTLNHLPEWRQIQSEVSKLVLSFRSEPQ